jgi:hypothetical protein
MDECDNSSTCVLRRPRFRAAAGAFRFLVLVVALAPCELERRSTNFNKRRTEKGNQVTQRRRRVENVRTGMESEEAHGSAPAARREEPSRLPMDGFVGGRRCSASPVLLAEGGVSLHFLAFSLHFLGWKTAGLMFGSFTRALLFRLSVLFGPL